MGRTRLLSGSDPWEAEEVLFNTNAIGSSSVLASAFLSNLASRTSTCRARGAVLRSFLERYSVARSARIIWNSAGPKWLGVNS